MNKILLLAALGMTAWGCTSIPVGYRGIKVSLTGDQKGVQTKELEVGRHWYWPWSTDIFRFPVFQRNYVWAAGSKLGGRDDRSISFQSMDGISANADIGISYSIDPARVTQIFQKFRRGIDEITNVYLRNLVSDALNNVASEMPIETVFGKGRVALLDKVNRIVIAKAANEGILVDHIYAVGDFRVPALVVAAINAKVEARQRAQQRQNEIREAQAEAAKKTAIANGEAEALMVKAKADADAAMVKAKAEADSTMVTARADADAIRLRAQARADALLMRAKAEAQGNTLTSKSLTTDLIELERYRRWDGRLPRITGPAIPFLNVERLGK